MKMIVETLDIGQKFRVVGLIAAFFVVLYHCVYPVVGQGYCIGLYNYITKVAPLWCVPWVFFASGFWFARGKYVRNGGVKPFFSSKIRSLLIPYLCWSLIGLIPETLLVMLVNKLQGFDLFQRSIFSLSSVWGVIDNVFAIVRPDPIGNGPLWYVRVLMLLFCMAPILRWIVRAPIVVRVILCTILFLLDVYAAELTGIRWLSAQLGFFFVGMIVGSDGMCWALSYQPSRRILCILWLALVASGFVLIDYVTCVAFKRFYSFCSILLVWWSVNAMSIQRGFFSRINGMSFWLFVCHYGVANWIRSIANYTLASTQPRVYCMCGGGGGVIVTCVVTVLVIVVTLFLGGIVKRLCPSFYSVLNGLR